MTAEVHSPAPVDGEDPLADADYRALAEFRYALRVFLRFSEDAARRAGLTPAQHQLLLATRGWAGDGPPSIADVAEMLQLRPNSVTELVERAVAAGLLRTGSDPRDRRRQRLELTAAGAERLAALSMAHRAELSRFRSQLQSLLAILPELPEAGQ